MRTSFNRNSSFISICTHFALRSFIITADSYSALLFSYSICSVENFHLNPVPLLTYQKSLIVLDATCAIILVIHWFIYSVCITLPGIELFSFSPLMNI